MAIKDCFVSVVAPLSNDGAILESFADEVLSVLRANYSNYELILVDDGSEDDTAQRMGVLLKRQPCIRYIRLSRSFGVENAIASGLDMTIGDMVVVMMPDSDPPALVPEMVEQARSGVGNVYGVRTSRQGEPFWLRAGAALFYWLCVRLLDIHLPKNSTHFRALSRKAVNAVTRIKDRYRYLRLLSSSVGYSSREIPYEPLHRHQPPRHRSFMQSVGLAMNIMVSQSTNPLRLVSWLGLGASLVNVVYMGYVLAIYLLKSTVAEGWTTLSLQVGGLFFLVFLILSVLSEYIGRLMEESRERPLYHVLDEQNSNVLLAEPERRNIATDSAPEQQLSRVG
ncbi:glycosyltransferase family 2 protein [Vitiosangium sp. GDMCC 1.1324]|uniref:glycosyltransferase family 2 protein n=1 Tax=Vitiosangium sp. (strain GDMCC 1.1324) TaxID=2138576 RepID=UPI000D377BDB|nr:glycosyltransferase family 2 protein [Vitiosangium sp. GDMCC 1.1324]PTL80224.1 glycosyltransferase [Vitiosangium sp. GDMCC 1.1324]